MEIFEYVQNSESAESFQIKGKQKVAVGIYTQPAACPRPSSLPACHFTGNKSFVFKLEVAGEGVTVNFILKVNVAERNCKSSLFFLFNP